MQGSDAGFGNISGRTAWLIWRGGEYLPAKARDMRALELKLFDRSTLTSQETVTKEYWLTLGSQRI